MKLAADQATRAMNALLAHPIAGPLVDRTPPLSPMAPYAEPLADWERELLESPHEAETVAGYVDEFLALLRGDDDPINHPTHYAKGWSNGAEVIDITENLNFNRGNAIKYLARAGVKHPDTEIEDLRKAAWYVEREIMRLETQW